MFLCVSRPWKAKSQSAFPACIMSLLLHATNQSEVWRSQPTHRAGFVHISPARRSAVRGPHCHPGPEPQSPARQLLTSKVFKIGFGTRQDWRRYVGGFLSHDHGQRSSPRMESAAPSRQSQGLNQRAFLGRDNGARRWPLSRGGVDDTRDDFRTNKGDSSPSSASAGSKHMLACQVG